MTLARGGIVNDKEKREMKKTLRLLFAGIAIMLVIPVAGCNNAESSKNAVLSTGEQVGKAVVQGSINELSKTMKLGDQSANAYASRAAIKYTMGDREGAIADFTKAIEIDPKSVAAYSGRGSARVAKGDIAGASADFIEAGKLMVFSKLKAE
ncbi:MAG: tetratricopeptide repeat protein [Chlorobiaceae bacterium]|jgi:tetratricopeptide (TPR) repeat protein